MGHFSIEGTTFAFDGKPFRILSGALHYFRVVPQYWHDRLLKLRALGLNTVETYVPWNLHEPKPGEFCFDGILDIERFIRLAGELGLYVIVRPGPYICAEWEFGGLPAWLLEDPTMKCRCNYPPYITAVKRFFSALLPRLAPWQVTQNGPVIAMQVENEYGSFGSDKGYLQRLEEMYQQNGIDVLLFTSDGATDWMLQGGTLPHMLKVVNFGSGAKRQFAKLREHQPDGPLMCGEFWNGWFDHWGEQHHTRDAHDVAAELDEVLQQGASVNLYMFHGGTNFGFMNGANHTGTEYQPTVTSYDYSAPLNEAGDPTPTYYAFRDVIRKYAQLPCEAVPVSLPKRAYGRVHLTESVSLFDVIHDLSCSVERPTPEPMEMLGQSYGFILYRTQVTGPREACPLYLQEVHDRALVFVNGEYKGTVERGRHQEITLGFGAGHHQLDILVENMGRVNYGPLLHDRKGITQGVRLSNQFLHGWSIYPLPLDNLHKLQFTHNQACRGPFFRRGMLMVDTPCDTFLRLPGWTKGVCFVNGFNLGRYWERGPQKTLYVPGPLLHQGANEIIVFELHGLHEPVIEFVAEPELG